MNKRNFMFLALLGAMVLNGHGEVRAQDASRWHNVDVNQQNRAPRRAAFFAFENQDKAQAFEKKNSANYLSMEALGNLISSRTTTSVLSISSLPTLMILNGRIFLYRACLN